MSSSRSIAAARQKRAGEPSNNVNTNSSRPVTSISSQAVFAQQQQQQQQQPRQQQINPKYNQINTSAGRQQMSGISQNQKPNSSSLSSQQKQLTKISLPDAIGLITLRLGKLEKFIQESMEDGSFSFMSGNNNNEYESNNMKLVSDEVFENITNRLENLEKKNNTKTNNNNNDQILKVNKDIKDIKDSINNLNTKVSSFINETQEKFLDYESALVEIEKNIGVSIDDNNYDEQENENIDDYTENIVSETIEDSVGTSGFVVDDNDTLKVEDVEDEEDEEDVEDEQD